MSTYTPPDAEGYSAFETTPDDDGDLVEAERDPQGRLSVGHSGIGGACVPDAEQRALAAFILGWPVDELTRVDPATHVVVNRPSAEAAEFALRRLAGPANTAETRPWDAAASVFRAALGEVGTR